MNQIARLMEQVNVSEPLHYENFFDRFRLNLRYHFAERLNLPIAKPHWVYISLTNNCNYHCHMCGVIKQDQTTKLSTEKLKSLIDEIAIWKSDQIITFTGGEVFLRRDLFDLLDYSTSKGVKTEMITNASLINDKKAKWLINSKVQSINISLDGSVSEIHNKIRNQHNAFELTTSAIKRLVKYKRQNNGKGPQLSIWTTIQRWNVHDLHNVTLLAAELGVDKHIFHPIIINQCDMQKEADTDHNPLWPKVDEIPILKKQVDLMVKYEKEKGLIAFIHDPYLLVDYFNGHHNKKAWKCNPFQFLNIGPDGKTQVCGDSFGNIKETTITDAYLSEKAAEHRKLMKKCTLNCLQTCWARPEADNLSRILERYMKDVEEQISIGNIRGGERSSHLKRAMDEIHKYETLVLQVKN